MQSKRVIATVVLLLGAFTLFNVGMPVSLYLCPMMSGENPFCDMSVPAATGESAITHQASACCAKIIVAERKTTPFLKAQDTLPFLEKSAILPAPDDELFAAVSSNENNPDLFGIRFTQHSPPAFLLNSSFLL